MYDKFSKYLQRDSLWALFSVDVPISQIDESTIAELNNAVKRNYRYKVPPDLDFGFRVTEPIPSNLIVDCEHPHKIRDPLNWGTYYFYTVKSHE